MARILLLIAAILGSASFFLTQPLVGLERHPAPARVDPERLRAHVKALSETMVPRDALHVSNLDRASDYIRDHFMPTRGQVAFQSYAVNGKTYCNVIARFGPESPEVIVVGAHYDAAGPAIGADDNASGVAGLLELASLLGSHGPSSRIELVAYTLEEPPYFRTESMGSFVHADQLRREGTKVRAMLSLEMLGYFTDAPETQTFPIRGLGLLYPTEGNFIAVAGRLRDVRLVRTIKRAMAESMEVPVWSMNAPSFIPGIDFSDHLNYWGAGYGAVMISDTAFDRNPNYHQATDTAATLDFEKMAQVVEGVYAAVNALAR